MIVYPAIDLKDGHCVRLVEGDFNRKTVFSDNPAKMALRWEQEGAEFLHLVDLDGALNGQMKNLNVIKDILEAVKIPVQLGGGLRTLDEIKMAMYLGVNRVILGSVALQEPKLVQDACKEYPGKVVVGIDAKDGKVAVNGWGQVHDVTALELALKMKEVGVERIIFTDILRDGKLQGVNVETTAALAQKSGLRVIASGGVSSIDDVIALKQFEQSGIEGFIVGRAIYTGDVELSDLIKVAKGD